MSPARTPLLALAHRDFRRLLGAYLVSGTGSQMQSVAIHWHVYLLTRSPLALGLVGLTRVLPIVLFSLWGGVLADRVDRRKLMLFTQSFMAAAAGLLAILTFSGGESLWVLYALTASASGAAAFDAPARQALIPRLVPDRDLPGALSINLSVFQVGLIAGPALAGWIIAGHAMTPGRAGVPAGAVSTGGLAWIYLVNAASFLAVLFALATMRASGRPLARAAGPAAHPIADLKEGIRFVFQTPLIVWTMAVDFFATFFAGAMSLLPIFADQVLRVGAAGYGFLVSAPAVGALAASLYLSVRPLPVRQGRVFLWAVAGYGLATIVFGFSRHFPLTLAALAAIGAADAVSTVIRQTLRQFVTPDALRGRMTSVNMIFFMGGPQLGELEAGLVASLFASAAVGVTVAVVSGGVATLVVAAGVALLAPALRAYRFEDGRSGDGAKNH
ncbi:MAG: MFS transporter [Acidobacteria bacterium]|nr:MFS transporter [Acidobacteriota bacterium]MCA1612244.1 MFS transporter [Acidobacteriota bacterium]